MIYTTLTFRYICWGSERSRSTGARHGHTLLHDRKHGRWTWRLGGHGVGELGGGLGWHRVGVCRGQLCTPTHHRVREHRRGELCRSCSHHGVGMSRKLPCPCSYYRVWMSQVLCSGANSKVHHGCFKCSSTAITAKKVSNLVFYPSQPLQLYQGEQKIEHQQSSLCLITKWDPPRQNDTITTVSLQWKTNKQTRVISRPESGNKVWDCSTIWTESRENVHVLKKTIIMDSSYTAQINWQNKNSMHYHAPVMPIIISM